MASGSGRQEEGPMSFLEQDLDSPGRAARPAPRLFVDSEVGPLRRVLLHRPDLELSRLTPAHKDELRFDDVLWVRRAHDAFADTLAEAGVEVLYLQELLAQVLADAGVRTDLIARSFEAAMVCPRLRGPAREWLDGLTAEEVASWLIGGIAWQDLPVQLPGLAGQVAMPGRVRARPAAEPHLHPRHVGLDLQRRLDQCDGRDRRAAMSRCTWRPSTVTPRCSRRSSMRSGVMVWRCPRRWKAATSPS